MAEALVGGALLSATLQVLFDRLASREVMNFFRGRKNVEELLNKLKLKLPLLDALVNDAEDKQISNQAVKDWPDELRDAVYQADDLLDKIAYEALRCNVKAEYKSGTTQVRDFISTSPPSSFDAEIESKLKEINDRLEDFAKNNAVLGLRGVAQNCPGRLPSTSLVDESGVYGRDNDKQEIITRLLSNEASGNVPGVIPIVGMGGVGNTTLAQLVYNDVSVVDHFEMQAWVCVSDEFDVSKVTKSILEEITECPCNTENLNQVQVSLKEKLRGKKFLIVLDDVWNDRYDDWEILRRPLTAGAFGSKIIATTRNQNVASIMGTFPAHNLQQLSDEDCWSLFAEIAFNKGDPSAHPIFEVIGKKIVEIRCKGLPLAAKTLAGLLRSKLDDEKWYDILESNIWDLPKDKNYILPALRLSYHYLPSHLKQCFAFCSVYPKGYIFEKESLVLLWIAQNFVQQPRGNRTIKRVGNEYFDELVSRSFFQQASGYKSSFIMHDLVHDLAEALSGEFSFGLEEHNKLDDIPKKVRHFSYVRGVDDGTEIFKAINEIKHLRTFLPLRSVASGLDNKVWNVLPTLPCIRVLSLSHFKIMEFPNWIGNMIHLRYLDLSFSGIRRLPESVCSLYHLQTLLLSYCGYLTTLPIHMGKLICLRHLDIRGTNLMEMPMQISQLKGLQQLTAFVVGNHSDNGLGVNGLKELCQLQGTLSISKLQNVRSSKDALEAKLKEKKLLQELVLEWGRETDDSHNERDVLQNLQPHANLKRLTIRHYGGTTFPGWLGDLSFSNMVSLCLRDCKYCFSLPTLGQLPSLKDLTIERMDGITKVGLEFYGDVSLVKPFQSLERLSFETMLEWEEWIALGVEEFCRLQKLSLWNCPKLTGALPTHISSLVNLEIKYCPELKPFPPLGRMQSLEKLVIYNCPEIDSLPEGGLLSNVCSLSINECKKLKALPERMHTLLPSLRELSISNCPEIESFPKGDLPSICSLSIEHCKKLKALPEQMHTLLPSLQFLWIFDCPEIESFPSFPEWGLPANSDFLHFYSSLFELAMEIANCQ